MESSESIDDSWESSTATVPSSDLGAQVEAEVWMVNTIGKEVIEMAHTEVLSKWRSGELSDAALVWREGMEEWMALRHVPAFRLAAPRTSQFRPITRPASTPPPAIPLLPEQEASEDSDALAVYDRPAATLSFSDDMDEESQSTLSRGPRPAAGKSPPAALRQASPTLPGPPPVVRPAKPAQRATPVKHTPAAVKLTPAAVIPVDALPPPPPLPGVAGPSGKTTFRGSSAEVVARAMATPGPGNASEAVPSLTERRPVPLEPATKSLAPSSFTIEEESVAAGLQPVRGVSLRAAILACVGSALVASLLTALVFRSRAAAAPPPRAVEVARSTPSAPSPALVVEAPPVKPEASTEASAAPPPAETKVVEAAPAPPAVTRAKPRSRKWRPASASSETPAGSSSSLEPSSKDDPESAVPDRPADEGSPARPATWEANPGF